MAPRTGRRTRRRFLTSLGAAGALGLAGCTGTSNNGGSGGTPTPTATATSTPAGTTASSSGKDPIGPQDSVKAAWLYVGSVGDLGWSWAHDQGRKKADAKFDWLTTSYSENVAPADTKRVLEQYVNKGYQIMYATSFGHMDPMYQVASQTPKHLFEHCSGYKTRENMGRYYGKMDQAKYLAGVAAGMLTTENKLGFVAPFSTPEVIRLMNALALGAGSVNPDVSFTVKYVNSWFDPTKSKQSAQALIDDGIDVIVSDMDSPATVKAGADAGIWTVGYDAPMGQYGGSKYITSPIWHWEVFYEQNLKAVHDGTWHSYAYWDDISSGIVGLDSWGSKVPSDVESKVADAKSKIASGDLDIWQGSKFEGKSGKFLFQEMNSYVKYIQGKVPQS